MRTTDRTGRAGGGQQGTAGARLSLSTSMARMGAPGSAKGERRGMADSRTGGGAAKTGFSSESCRASET